MIHTWLQKGLTEAFEHEDKAAAGEQPKQPSLTAVVHAFVQVLPVVICSMVCSVLHYLTVYQWLQKCLTQAFEDEDKAGAGELPKQQCLSVVQALTGDMLQLSPQV